MWLDAGVLGMAKYIDRCVEVFGGDAFTAGAKWSEERAQQAQQLWQQCQQEAEEEVRQQEAPQEEEGWDGRTGAPQRGPGAPVIRSQTHEPE